MGRGLVYETIEVEEGGIDRKVEIENEADPKVENVGPVVNGNY